MSDWHDVNTEPLPEPDLTVLVYREQRGFAGSVDTARLVITNDGGGAWCNDNWHRDVPLEEEHITHWMYLPASPSPVSAPALGEGSERGKQ
jgi:hypothetical protein